MLAYNEIKEMKSLCQLLSDCVKIHGNGIAIKEYKDAEEICITYTELYKKVIKVKEYIKKCGIEYENIGIIGNLSYEWIICYFGIMMSNNVVVPLNYESTSAEIDNDIYETNIKMVFLVSNMQYSGSKYEHIMCGQVSDILKNEVLETSDSYALINENKDAMIVFTTGTTGKKKGVVLTHENIIRDVLCCIEIIGKNTFAPGETILAMLPPYHMLQITTGILSPIVYGVTICICDNILVGLKKYRPSILVVVPLIVDTFYKKINSKIHGGKSNSFIKNIVFEKSGWMKKILQVFVKKKIREVFGSNLKLIVSGGAKLDTIHIDYFEQLGIELLEGYGITECSPVICCNKVGEKKKGSVGRINQSQNCEVRIIQNEICVRGTVVFKEYYNNVLETEQVKIDGWFFTGDLGYIDEDGFLYVVGRKKNLIILPDGNNISPEELENMLEKYEIIENALVYEEIGLKGSYLVADVWIIENHDISDIGSHLEEIRRKINSSISSYKRITSIRIAKKELIKNKLGKIERYKYTLDSQYSE